MLGADMDPYTVGIMIYGINSYTNSTMECQILLNEQVAVFNCVTGDWIHSGSRVTAQSDISPEKTATDAIADDSQNTLDNGSISTNILQSGSYVTFGTYPQGAIGEVEPIEWLVLDVQDGKALLISRYGLDTQLYNKQWSDITWEQCTLRSWLNSDFINTAFNMDEQAAILLTDVDNSASQCFDFTTVSKGAKKTKGGNDTQDRLFLLSYAEAKQYFGIEYRENIDSDNVKARVQPTAYCVAHGAFTNSDYETS